MAQMFFLYLFKNKMCDICDYKNGKTASFSPPLLLLLLDPVSGMDKTQDLGSEMDKNQDPGYCLDSL
jgi:hypothetical protein